MPPAPRPSKRRRWALAWGLVLGSAATAWTQPTCLLDVQVTGTPDAVRLRARLLEDAQRSGVCAHSWSLRVTPATESRFSIALWNGSTLETRLATSAREIEVVAGLLMRAAIDEATPEPAASVSTSASASASASVAPPASALVAPPASASAPAASASSAPETLPPAPDPGASSRVEPPAGPSFEVGPTLSTGIKLNAGASVEGGILVTWGRLWRVGLWPTLGGAWGHGVVRQDVSLPAVLIRSVELRKQLTVGAGIAVGPEGGWSSVRDGSSAGTHGFGWQFGAWPELGIGVPGDLRWWFALPVRYSTTTGVRPGSTSAEVTTADTISQPPERLGGWSMMLLTGLAR